MNIITVRPGPVLHIWRGGEEVAAVPLSPSAALSIASDLLAAIVAQAGAPEGRQADLRSTLNGNIGTSQSSEAKQAGGLARVWPLE